MIKGVNRQIIEITETGNPYFERALLIVRPGFSDVPDERIREEAHRLVQAAGGYSGLRRNRRKRRKLVLLGGGTGLAGLCLGGLLSMLIH